MDRRIYGFEGYRIIGVSTDIFRGNASKWGLFYGYYSQNSTLVPNNDYNAIQDKWGNTEFITPPYTDHPELLERDKKVYVHKTCKISRTMLSSKYKKCLDPYKADIIVVPEYDAYGCRFCSRMALFVNDKTKLILSFNIDDSEITEKLLPHIGSPLKDLISDREQALFDNKEYLEATLEYLGSMFSVPDEKAALLDALMGVIPANRTVYENTIQESLGSEDNQLTSESLISIKEMLASTDSNTRNAAWKALSMMDFVHYPNSIKYIFTQLPWAGNWKYDKATCSTSVKFMLKSLFPRCRNWKKAYGDYSKEIYPQDYEVIKKLLLYYENIDETAMLGHDTVSFMKINSEGVLVPNYISSPTI